MDGAVGSAWTYGIVFVWYTVSVLTICTSKVILERLPAPGLLCFYQSCVSAVGAWVAMRVAGAKPYFSRQLPYLIFASLTYALNLAFTNVSFLRGSAPLTETIKSTEPVIVSLLAIPTLGEKLTVVGLFAVFCISAGTAIACVSDTLIVTFGGIFFASMAVFCQGASSVSIKLLNLVPLPMAEILPETTAGSPDLEKAMPPHLASLTSLEVESLDAKQLSHRISIKEEPGVPTPRRAGESESPKRWAVQPEKIQAVPMTVERRPIHPTTLFFNVSMWSMAISGLYSAVVREAAAWEFLVGLRAMLTSQVAPTALETDAMTTLGLLSINAVCFATYNLAAYVVLRKMSATNYSVLNSLRRVVVILISTFVFNLDFTFLSVVGVGVAFVGFTSHAYRGTGLSCSDCVVSVHKRLFKAQDRAM